LHSRSRSRGSSGSPRSLAVLDGDAKTTATLEPRSPAGLEKWLAEYDRLMASNGSPAAIADAREAIDHMAAQRDAQFTRLYWHTDLGEAEAEAKRTNRPILSLRLLGRLDEELSCANPLRGAPERRGVPQLVLATARSGVVDVGHGDDDAEKRDDARGKRTPRDIHQAPRRRRLNVAGWPDGEGVTFGGAVGAPRARRRND
jgi:hypothetical protein